MPDKAHSRQWQPEGFCCWLLDRQVYPLTLDIDGHREISVPPSVPVKLLLGNCPDHWALMSFFAISLYFFYWACPANVLALAVPEQQTSRFISLYVRSSADTISNGELDLKRSPERARPSCRTSNYVLVTSPPAPMPHIVMDHMHIGEPGN